MNISDLSEFLRQYILSQQRLQMNFKSTPEHTWKGLICGIVLYMLFAIAPAIIILRYFLHIDYGSLMIGVIAMLICFVIGRKTYWAQGDRAMAMILSFFRSNEKNNRKEFNHDKNQDILEVSLDKNDMAILYLLMLYFAFGIAIAVHSLFFGEIELRFPGIDDIWKFLGCICLIIILHEALHAFVALLWGRVPWSSIHFGVKWRPLMFYCHCDKPLKVNTFRILVLFPLIITTPIAGLIWWLDPSIWSLLLFSLTIAFCAGDVLMFFRIRQVENDKWIQDHPSEPGFYILPEAILVFSEEHDR